MSFFEVVEQFKGVDFEEFFARTGEAEVKRSLAKNKPGVMDFLTLLSPAAAHHLEAMAALVVICSQLCCSRSLAAGTLTPTET